MDALNKVLPGLKAKLTRAINSNNPDKVLIAVQEAELVFETVGYPDQWSRWDIAKGDAVFAKLLNRKTLRAQ